MLGKINNAFQTSIGYFNSWLTGGTGKYLILLKEQHKMFLCEKEMRIVLINRLCPARK